ncbi:MAG: 5-formyltetrahydrofolate cyclo-ligase [Gloeomargaritaceae cyanobacterium C42_A2020_066]|nr:5-formyltetrahydrofolate cyclo-ligase [Gloeomargaritaceae cyanobacterium C42_A2020_066]
MGSKSELGGTKTAFRQAALQERMALSAGRYTRLSAQLCAHLAADPLWSWVQTVLAFCPVQGEPSLAALYPRIGVPTWGFPRCQGRDLTWHCTSPAGPWQRGPCDIPEPLAAAPQLHPAQIDLMLVPCLACDDQGYRLGYGGGYYDRLLSQPEWQQVPTLGILWAAGRVAQLPRDPWDQPLWGCCTEAGLAWFRSPPAHASD